MNWFGYVWIVVLALAYVIWTIKSIVDFISDVKGIWKLSFILSEGDRSWVWWIGIHAIIILAGSLAYFLLMVGGTE